MRITRPKCLEAFKTREVDNINLEAIFRDDKDLVQEYVNRQNRFAIQVISVIALLINLFWLLTYIIRPTDGGDLLGRVATTFMVVFPSFAILYVAKDSDKSAKSRFRIVVVLFHACITLSVMLLEISRGFTFSKTSMHMAFNNVSLSLCWTIACAFMPLISMTDSILVITLIMLSGIVPCIVCPPGSCNLTNNLLICLSVVFAHIAFRSITIRSANLVNKLAETSYVDFQTRSLNRRALTEYFDGIKKRRVDNLGIMVIDIDDLRLFNESSSHASGDEAIIRIGNEIKKLDTGDGMVFRYSGDEFVAMVQNTNEEMLLRMALKVRDTVEGLGIERNDDCARKFMTVTIGCYLVPGDRSSDIEVLGEAEAQLAIGKNGAKDCVVMNGKIFLSESEINIDHKPSQYTEKVHTAVTEAMKRHEIVPYFQPLYDASTNKLVGAEALARWIKDDGVAILPKEFIPELEKDSSILDLDWYMYEECCKMLQKQMKLGIPQVRISVNFSRMHALYERNIENRLRDIADAYNVPHHLIQIEITESAYINLPSIIESFIKGIRSEGFAVAVDDFGSGASSLEFLKSVDVDTLKIDKSLISSNCTDPKECVLLESVVFLAHRLQLNSVAEGVETPEQLVFLKSLGCNQIQGFIFAKPMPEAAFLEKCRTEVSEDTTADLILEYSKSPSIKMLLDTVFKRYPIVIMGNLTKDSYYTMTYDSFTSHNYSKVGTITDLLAEIESTLLDEDKERFKRTFDIRNQIKAFNSGQDKIVFDGRIHGDDPWDKDRYKKIETTTYFIKETGNEDVQVITLCSEKIRLDRD